MKSKSINDERFALVKVNLKNKVVQDHFTNEIVMENIDKSIFKSGWDNKMLIKNNELLLIANNGTTINFHKKIGKEWENFMGLGLGLFMPNLIASQWESALDNCDYYYVNSRDSWGRGKKNNATMWSDTKIVKMILKDKEKRGGKR